MGLCEIADEDMMGEAAKPKGALTEEFQEFGYYYDERGVKRFGPIPSTKRKKVGIVPLTEAERYGFRWIDAAGNPRYDNKFNVTDVHDLDES
jgi:hypothetical protein